MGRRRLRRGCRSAARSATVYLIIGNASTLSIYTRRHPPRPNESTSHRRATTNGVRPSRTPTSICRGDHLCPSARSGGRGVLLRGPRTSLPSPNDCKMNFNRTAKAGNGQPTVKCRDYLIFQALECTETTFSVASPWTPLDELTVLPQTP